MQLRNANRNIKYRIINSYLLVVIVFQFGTYATDCPIYDLRQQVGASKLIAKADYFGLIDSLGEFEVKEIIKGQTEHNKIRVDRLRDYAWMAFWNDIKVDSSYLLFLGFDKKDSTYYVLGCYSEGCHEIRSDTVMQSLGFLQKVPYNLFKNGLVMYLNDEAPKNMSSGNVIYRYLIGKDKANSFSRKKMKQLEEDLENRINSLDKKK